MRYISIVIALATLLFVSTSSAQQAATTAVPSLIRYGGALKDAQGANLSPATLGITFAIYKQQDGGAPVWLETQNVTTDASGNYSVLLGSTTATGLPSDLFSQQEQRWLGVQVQGQAEQPRVLLVSVPYAFKAHEAETLGGKGISDFVLAKNVGSANSTGSVVSSAVSGSAQQAVGQGNNKSVSKLAASEGPTNFSGSTTDRIVGVTQLGSGAGIVTSTSTPNTSNAVVGSINGPGVAIFGQANSTSAQGYGVEGITYSNVGIGVLGFATATVGGTYGVKGYSSSTSGTGMRGLSTATTGYTTGIGASVASPLGTAAVLNNTAGGKIISGQNNGVEKFNVDGSGNVNAVSTYRLGGSTVLSIAGTSNLFVGVGAGSSNTSGFDNTFTGFQTGYLNTTGGYNTFAGFQSGYFNTTGGGNTFNGFAAGLSNNSGSQNSFFGLKAGLSNTSGYANTFIGYTAGFGNQTGFGNTFIGYATGNQSAGNYNTFSGSDAGYYNTTGSNNVFSGFYAGAGNTTGGGNVYIGSEAGFSSNGTDNIYVGDAAGYGIADENNTMRLGSPPHVSSTYLAGIYGVNVSGVPVQINSSGQLGTVTSSRRYKEQVRDMGTSTSALMKLRPVTFVYKPEYSNGDRTMQYGLIAEEVAEVYPGLVEYGKDARPFSVRYQLLIPMLLNEVQKQYRRAEAEATVITMQEQKIEQLEQRLSRLEVLFGTQVMVAGDEALATQGSRTSQ